MNIEATATKPVETSTKAADSSTSASTGSSKDDSTSFKDQLAAVKTQEATAVKTKDAEALKETEAADAQKNVTIAQIKPEDAAKNVLTQQIAKDKLTKQTEAAKNSELADPVEELSSKIATLTELKSGISKTQGAGRKTTETLDKDDLCQTIKMDSKDVSFFLSLVDNQQMSAQAAQGSASDSSINGFTDIKSEATQKTVQVSATLLDAMNESSKTGKPFRIDFDSNVAVIMKLDKNGTISANFIPGDTAVENYLRNNIAGLRQSFDGQGLSYNELSYSKQQKQEQQEKRKNNKENENE